jgi:hypothetical protein
VRAFRHSTFSALSELHHSSTGLLSLHKVILRHVDEPLPLEDAHLSHLHCRRLKEQVPAMTLAATFQKGAVAA